MPAATQPRADAVRLPTASLTADDRLWGAFWESKRGGRKGARFRINRFCQDAVREGLPPIGSGRQADIGEIWVNRGEARARMFHLDLELRALVAYYASGLGITKSELLCTLIRRKQEREGIAL